MHMSDTGSVIAAVAVVPLQNHRYPHVRTSAEIRSG